jgi:hypothetical protein
MRDQDVEDVGDATARLRQLQIGCRNANWFFFGSGAALIALGVLLVVASPPIRPVPTRIRHRQLKKQCHRSPLETSTCNRCSTLRHVRAVPTIWSLPQDHGASE